MKNALDDRRTSVCALTGAPVLFYFREDFFSRRTVRLRQGIAVEASSQRPPSLSAFRLPTTHGKVITVIIHFQLCQVKHKLFNVETYRMIQAAIEKVFSLYLNFPQTGIRGIDTVHVDTGAFIAT